ncbi:hypothetical protein RKD35_006688 [Streptomyces albogriseolus]
MVLDVDEVEPAEHRAVLHDQYVEGADAGVLLGQQRVEPAGEPLEELVAAIGDRGSEVRAVRQLESQHRRGMTGVEPLQLGHEPDPTFVSEKLGGRR